MADKLKKIHNNKKEAIAIYLQNLANSLNINIGDLKRK